MGFTDFDQLPLVLSVDDLMTVLSIGRNSAYDLINNKRIRSVRCGHIIRIPKDALIEFLGSEK